MRSHQILRLAVVAASACTTAGLALAIEAKVAGTLEGHTAAVYSVAWSPDGSKVVTGAFAPDSTIKVWDPATRKAIKTLQGHTDIVLAVAIDPSGKRILSGSQDKSARIWEMPGSLAPSKTLSGPAGIPALALRPDGKQAAAASGKGLTIWDLDAGKPARRIDSAAADVESVAWRGDSAQVAAGDKAGTIRLYNPADGAPQGTIDQPADTVLALAYLPDGKALVSAGSDGIARLWSLPVAAPRPIDAKGDAFAASADGSRIASSQGKEAIHIRDADVRRGRR